MAEPGGQGSSSGYRTADLIPPLARHFIRQEYEKIDPKLPELLGVLNSVGAAECWHKKSDFKSHLFEVYKILKIWGADDELAYCGLMHSAYGNSYVNLAVFKPDVERSRLAELVGPEAEELVHLFCVVPRQRLIQVDLLDRLPRGGGGGGEALDVPEGGMTVPHIRTGEPLHVDTFRLGQFLVLTMADFAEQLQSWQDSMFGNTDGLLKLERCPAPEPRILWPHAMKPGLWVSAISRMGRLVAACKRRLEAAGDPRTARLPVPPVFERCGAVLGEEEQEAARDLYWSVVSDPDAQRPAAAAGAAAKMRRAAELNPYVAEPRLMLAQLHLHAGEWDEARAHAEAALRLLLEWGTSWDKRMSWGTWVAWARVCAEAAAARSWPATPMGVLSLGMVEGL